MGEEKPHSVAAWISEVSSSPGASPDSQTQDTPTKISQKRKRFSDHQFDLPQQQSQLRQPLTHTALAELSLNIMNTPSPSVGKRAAKKIKNANTPRTDPSKFSNDATSRPPTTPGGSSSSKQTPNKVNVRMASARHGMFFEDEKLYEKFSEFKVHIENMMFENRVSVMRIESI